MAKPRESFSAGEAAKITKVPYPTLDFWARTKLIVPGVAAARGTGTERRYSFKDLVALRVARELRAGGVSTQALRKVLSSVREMEDPLAEARLLAIGSSIVWVKNCNEM